jgi:acetyltransferase-like isoleucine patch superfamily enzyme
VVDVGAPIGGKPGVSMLRRLLRGCRRVLGLGASAIRICYLRTAFSGLSVGFDSFLGPGCDVYVGREARVVLRGVVVGRGCLIHAAPGAFIDIAAESIGPHSVIVARQRITIGEGSMLAEMTVVRDSDHDRTGGAALTAHRYRSSPVSIGRDVWLAARATVMSGVTIGDGATVGAGAVVTRDVAAKTTVVGVPSRPISYRGTDPDLRA